MEEFFLTGLVIDICPLAVFGTLWPIFDRALSRLNSSNQKKYTYTGLGGKYLVEIDFAKNDVSRIDCYQMTGRRLQGGRGGR